MENLREIGKVFHVGNAFRNVEYRASEALGAKPKADREKTGGEETLPKVIHRDSCRDSEVIPPYA